jgi:hypothetical protein
MNATLTRHSIIAAVVSASSGIVEKSAAINEDQAQVINAVFPAAEERPMVKLAKLLAIDEVTA